MTHDELVLRLGASFQLACEKLRERAVCPCNQTVVASVTLRCGRQTNMRLVEVIPVKPYQCGFYIEWWAHGKDCLMPRLFWSKNRRSPTDDTEPLALIERDWYCLGVSEEDVLIRAAT